MIFCMNAEATSLCRQPQDCDLPDIKLEVSFFESLLQVQIVSHCILPLAFLYDDNPSTRKRPKVLPVKSFIFGIDFSSTLLTLVIYPANSTKKSP